MSGERSRRGMLQRRLAEHLGEKLAEDLIGELPPDGWESMARQEDLTEVKFGIIAMRSNLDDVKADVADLRSDMFVVKSDVAVLQKDVVRMHGTMRFMIGSFITVSAAVIGILVQISFSVASLR